MKSSMLALMGIAGMSPALASPAPLPPPVYCPVVIYKDYYFAFGYYAAPALAPGCPPGGIGRLRKSSTVNLKNQGADYQPIHPLKGAWTVTAFGDNVPNSEQYVYAFSNWEWQYAEDSTHWHAAAVK